MLGRLMNVDLESSTLRVVEMNSMAARTRFVAESHVSDDLAHHQSVHSAAACLLHKRVSDYHNMMFGSIPWHEDSYINTQAN
jgi:hypothetical protein